MGGVRWGYSGHRLQPCGAALRAAEPPSRGCPAAKPPGAAAFKILQFAMNIALSRYYYIGGYRQQGFLRKPLHRFG